LAPIVEVSWPVPGGMATSTGEVVWRRDVLGAYSPPPGATVESSVIIPIAGPSRVEVQAEVIDRSKPVEVIQGRIGSNYVGDFDADDTVKVALTSATNQV